jgi:hypothetical protein
VAILDLAFWIEQTVSGQLSVASKDSFAEIWRTFAGCWQTASSIQESKI